MARTKAADNLLDPATGRALPQGVVYRGPMQYRARKMVKGKRLTKTFDTARLAREWLDDRSAEVRSGTYVDKTVLDHWTVKRLMARFLDEVLAAEGERRGAAEDRAHLPAILGDTDLCKLKLSEVDHYAIQEFGDRQLAKGYAKSTVVKRMNLLQQAFQKAISSWRLPMPSNPASGRIARRPKGADKKRNRTLFVPGEGEQRQAAEKGESELPDEEDVLYEVLGKSLNRDDLLITQFAVAQAARQGECLGLRWRDVDLDRLTLMFRGRTGKGTKSDDHREERGSEIRAMMPGARAVLLKMRETATCRRDEPVFAVGGYAAFRVRWGRLVSRAAERMTGCKKDLGYLADLTFHDLRHESTTRLSKLFPRNLDLMDVTGHKDVRSMKRYYNTRPEQLAAQAEAMLLALAQQERKKGETTDPEA